MHSKLEEPHAASGIASTSAAALGVEATGTVFPLVCCGVWLLTAATAIAIMEPP